MAEKFQPPPTFVNPVDVDPATGKASFNPIWLQWFLYLANFISVNGGSTGSAVDHNSLSGLQGGGSSEYFHFTAAEHTALTGGGSTTEHYHSSDRDRANHTGAQTLSTISDVTASAARINTLSSGISTTIATAKLTAGGSNGSMTFVNGVLTASTQAT